MSLIRGDFCRALLNANILKTRIYLPTKAIYGLWNMNEKLMRAWAHLLKFHSGQRNGSWSSSQRILEGPFHLKTMLEPVEVCGCIYHLKVMNVTVLFRPFSVLNITLYLFCCIYFCFFLSCCTDLRKAFFSFCMETFCCCGYWLLSRTCCSGNRGCSGAGFLPLFTLNI